MKYPSEAAIHNPSKPEIHQVTNTCTSHYISWPSYTPILQPFLATHPRPPLMKPNEQHPPPPTPALYFVASSEDLLDFQTILHGRSTTENPRLSSRHFEALKCEKISVDLGPWIRHVGVFFALCLTMIPIPLKLRSMDNSHQNHNYQIRIRSSKHGESYTLRRVIVKIVNLVKSILDAASYRVSQYHTSLIISHDPLGSICPIFPAGTSSGFGRSLT